MKNVMPGAVHTNDTAPTLYVGTIRRAILRLVVGNTLFTVEEQLRVKHNARECQDAVRLALWLRNVTRVVSEREAAVSLTLLVVATVPVTAQLTPATPAQCDRLHELAQYPHTTAAAKEKTLRLLPTYTQEQAKKAISRLQATTTRRTSAAEWQAHQARLQLLPLNEASRQLLLSRRQRCETTDILLCPTYPLPARQQRQIDNWIYYSQKGKVHNLNSGRVWSRDIEGSKAQVVQFTMN